MSDRTTRECIHSDRVAVCRLGVEGEGPDVEVFYGWLTMQGDIVPAAGHPDVHSMRGLQQGWFANPGRAAHFLGPYPTESAALAAARASKRS